MASNQKKYQSSIDRSSLEGTSLISGEECVSQVVTTCKQENLANSKVSARQHCVDEGPCQYGSIFIRLEVSCLSNLQNPAKFSVQAHPRSSSLVPIERACTTSY